MKKLIFSILISTLFLSAPAQNCLDVSVITDEVSCYDGDDGAIHLEVQNGVGPFTYNWGSSTHSSGNDYTIKDLSAKEYLINIADTQGCTYAAYIDVSEPDTLQQSVSGFVCGSGCWCITSLPAGGTPPYDYIWSTGETTPSITYCDSTSYYVSVTDVNGCGSLVINSLAVIAVPFNISNFNISPILCGGECTGGVSLNIFGGIPPYTYNWSNGDTTKDVFGLCAGQAFVTVVDATLNSIVKSFQIPETTPIEVDEIQISYVDDCDENCNGSIEVNTIGGIGSHTHTWLDKDGNYLGASLSIDDLCEGIYTLSVVDSINCLYTRDIAMLCQSEALQASLDVTQPSCVGCCDGQIQVNPINGFGPYEIRWSDEPFVRDILRENLCERTYTVTITDANGQEIELTATLDANITSTEDIALSHLQLAPNPVVSTTVLSLDLNQQTKVSAILTDINGQVVNTIFSEKAIQTGEFNQEIDLSGHPTGLYFLTLIADNGVKTTRKIVKM